MTRRAALPVVAVVSALAVSAAARHLAPCPDRPPQPADPDVLPADPESLAMITQMAAKNLVAREVIAGHTTVPEAASLYGWLDARPPRAARPRPGWLEHLSGLPDLRGYTESELLGVQVVAQVASVADRDGLGGGASDRARGEFLAARAEGEFGRLPAPPADRRARLLERARAEADKSMSGRPDARSVQTAE